MASRKRSCASDFWARPEIVGLTNAEQLTYLKLLTTSSMFDLHGLTIVQPLKRKGLSNKRKGAYLLSVENVLSLSKKGLIVYDSMNSIAFIPGATSDQEAEIDTYPQLRKVQTILKRFPPTSRAAQLWVLSWFLTNMSSGKISIVQDFLEYGQVWINGILNDSYTPSNIDESIDLKLTGLVSVLPYKDDIYVSHVVSTVVKEQRCFPGVTEDFTKQIVGENITDRLDLYLKRRDAFLDSVVHELMTQFESLFLEKKGDKYTKQTQDQQKIAWMVWEYGKDMIRERMRLYFNSLDYVHSIADFKSNFQKIGNPDTKDLSKYWEIIGEHEKRARGNN